MTEHRAHLTHDLLKHLFGVDATPEQLDQILQAAGEDSSNIYYEDLDREEEVRKLTRDDPYAHIELHTIEYVEGDEPEDGAQ